MAHDSKATSHAKTLPAELGAPAFVDAWKTRSVMVGSIFAVIAVILGFLGQAQDGLGWDHVLRAWTLGTMWTWGLCIGGLALLMVQYCSGGKWGLLLRRPFEALSRTLPVVFVYWLVTAIFSKKLYLWAQYTTHDATENALKQGWITELQAHCLNFKRPMLNPTSYWLVSLFSFALWAFYAWRLNSLALEREADRPENTPYWIKKFENICGPGLLIYSVTMTAGAIYWVMSMDVTWFSTVYGLLFLVGQGYLVLAFSIIVAISLSKAEPYKTILRQTEQHDLGKLAFAFVMLNIYLNFGQFLIIFGQPAAGDQLVFGSHSGKLGHHHHARFHLPLGDSVQHAALARPEAQQEAAGAGVPVDGVRARLRYVLADRAELQGRGAQPALQLWNSGIHCRAGRAVLLLAGLFLHAAEDASAGAGQRSAPGGNSGA
jgi:hypothetical protein